MEIVPFPGWYNQIIARCLIPLLRLSGGRWKSNGYEVELEPEVAADFHRPDWVIIKRVLGLKLGIESLVLSLAHVELGAPTMDTYWRYLHQAIQDQRRCSAPHQSTSICVVTFHIVEVRSVDALVSTYL